MPQFFLKPENIEDNTFSLDKSESYHLITVFKKKPEDVIQLFDGLGNVYEGVIKYVKDERVFGKLQVIKRFSTNGKLKLFAPLIKGERFDWLVEKVTEIGVHCIQPVITSRTTVKFKSKEKRDRWQKIAISAAKQSKAPFVPVIEIPVNFDKAVKENSKEYKNILFTGNENDPYPGNIIERLKKDSNSSCYGIWIGPEGGFSLQEIAHAKEEKYFFCSLGAQILRAETACIVSAALVKFEVEKK
ncbi:MAG: RsmE family RNA methyltransferase [bacterium]